MQNIDSHGIFTEERDIQGVAVTTPNLHNVRSGCPGYERPANDDGKWCFKRTNLQVETPGPNWIFVGQPSVKCVGGDCGGAGWSNLGAADRFFITRNNPNIIEAAILTGSHSFQAALICKARFYPPGLTAPDIELAGASELNNESKSEDKY